MPQLDIELQGALVKLKGDQNLSAILTPSPLLVHIDVTITCDLNLGFRTLDYEQLFAHTSFFQPMPPFDANPIQHFPNESD